MFCKKFQKFLKFYMKEPLLGFFIIKLQPAIAYEIAKVKDTRQSTLLKRDAYTETLTQVLSCRFWKSYEHESEHLCETASEIMSKKEFVI